MIVAPERASRISGVTPFAIPDMTQAPFRDEKACLRIASPPIPILRTLVSRSVVAPAHLHIPQFTEQRRQLPLQGCLIAAEPPGQALCEEGIERTPQNEPFVLIVTYQGSGGISGKEGIA